MKKLTPDEQVAFNHLHIKYIAEDKRFRDWAELTPEEKAHVIDSAEVLAEKEFLQTNQ
jgi:hypothetical protein